MQNLFKKHITYKMHNLNSRAASQQLVAEKCEAVWWFCFRCSVCRVCQNVKSCSHNISRRDPGNIELCSRFPHFSWGSCLPHEVKRLSTLHKIEDADKEWRLGFPRKAVSISVMFLMRLSEICSQQLQSLQSNVRQVLVDSGILSIIWQNN